MTTIMWSFVALLLLLGSTSASKPNVVERALKEIAIKNDFSSESTDALIIISNSYPQIRMLTKILLPPKPEMFATGPDTNYEFKSSVFAFPALTPAPYGITDHLATAYVCNKIKYTVTEAKVLMVFDTENKIVSGMNLQNFLENVGQIIPAIKAFPNSTLLVLNSGLNEAKEDGSNNTNLFDLGNVQTSAKAAGFETFFKNAENIVRLAVSTGLRVIPESDRILQELDNGLSKLEFGTALSGFRYEISNATREEIDQFVVKTERIMDITLVRVFTKWLDLLHSFVETKNSSVGYLRENKTFHAHHAQIKELVVASKSELPRVVLNILKGKRHLGVTVADRNSVYKISTRLDFSQLAEDLAGIKDKGRVTGRWLASLAKLSRFAGKYQKWYSWLSTVHKDSSTKSGRSLGDTRPEVGRVITRDNFDEIKAQWFIGTGNASIGRKWGSSLNERQLRQANLVLGSTDTIIDCNENKDDIYVLGDRVDFDQNLHEKLKTACPGGPRKNIYVFATIRVDMKGYRAHGGVLGGASYTIIAPSIDVVDSVVELVGEVGSTPTERNGEGCSSKKHGRPGGPGAQGGSVLIITKELSNPLTLISRGGNGGKGQDADYIGLKKQIDAMLPLDLPPIPDCTKCCDENYDYIHFCQLNYILPNLPGHCWETPWSHNSFGCPRPIFDYDSYSRTKYDDLFNAYYKKVEERTKVFDEYFSLEAGFGGIGGYPGMLKVIQLDGNQTVTLTQETGQRGQHGTPYVNSLLQYTNHIHVCLEGIKPRAPVYINDLPANINKFLVLVTNKVSDSGALLEFFQKILVNQEVYRWYGANGYAGQLKYLTNLDSTSAINNIREDDALTASLNAMKIRISNHAQLTTFQNFPTVSCNIKCTSENSPNREECVTSGRIFYKEKCWFTNKFAARPLYFFPKDGTKPPPFYAEKQYGNVVNWAMFYTILEDRILPVTPNIDRIAKRLPTRYPHAYVQTATCLDSGVLDATQCIDTVAPLNDVRNCLSTNKFWYPSQNKCSTHSPLTLNSTSCYEQGFSPEESGGCSKFLQRNFIVAIFVCDYHGEGFTIRSGRLECIKDSGELDDELNTCLENMKIVALRKTCKTPPNNVIENGHDTTKVLALVYTNVLTQLRLKNNGNTQLIIKIKDYLNAQKTVLEDYKATEKHKRLADHINQTNSEFEGAIQKKIEEGRKLIEDNIRPEVEALNRQMVSKTDELVVLIREAKSDAVANKAKLEKARRDMKAQIGVNIFCGILSFAAGIAALAGPKGMAVAGVLGAVGGATKLLQNEFGGNPTEVANSIIPQINEHNKQLANFVNKHDAEYLSQISTQLQKAQTEYKGLSDQDFKAEKMKYENTLLKRKLLESESVIDHTALRENTQMIKQDIKALKAKEKLSKNVNNLERIGGAINVLKAGVEIYATVKGDFDALDEIDSAINQLENLIKTFDAMEESVHSTLLPMINTINDENEKWANGEIHDESILAIKIAGHNSQKNINKMRHDMNGYTKGLGKDLDIDYITGNLDNAMATAFQMHEQIAKYGEDKELARYMALLNTPDYEGLHVSDPVLQQIIVDLDRSLVTNSIIWIYKRAMAAVLQFKFPFADKIASDFVLPGNLESKGVEDFARTAADRIKQLTQRLQVEEAVTDDESAIVGYQFFSGDENHDAFFTWESQKFGHVIRKVLKGEEVLLNADIQNSPEQFDAIKFVNISIEFRVNDPSIQEDLTAQLNNYKVVITHTGNSYYRFGREYYSFLTRDTKLEYEYSQAEGSFRNDNVKKLASGDYVLSPYTSWKLKLVGLKSVRKSFKKLEKFLDMEVDLVLMGWGKAIDVEENPDIPDLHLEKYYKADPVLSRMELAEAMEDEKFLRNSRGVGLGVVKRGRSILVQRPH